MKNNALRRYWHEVIIDKQAVWRRFWLNPRKGESHMTIFEVLSLLLKFVRVVVAYLSYRNDK